MAEFVMPVLGADMSAGTLLSWRKNPGDVIERGDVIAEVQTDKAAVEVESFVPGVLEEVLVQPGEKVPVGTVLAIIKGPGEPASARRPLAAPARPAPAAKAELPKPEAALAKPAPTGLRVTPSGLRVTPLARQLAAKLRVDIETVLGSGPGGRIQERDVQAASEAVKQRPQPEEDADRRTRMRQAIAAAMSRSAREIPHFHLASTVDMGRAFQWLAETNKERPIAKRLLYVALLLKAVALGLREVPELNGMWSDQGVVRKPDIHVGMAISLRGGGLVAPAIHHTDKRSLDDLMENVQDLVRRARAGSFRSSELSDPTVTVTNLGDQGAESVFGLIYPPQVALVGFGKVVERPWSVGRKIVSRPLMNASLSADHRVVDGHRASIFLNALDQLLQEPEKL